MPGDSRGWVVQGPYDGEGLPLPQVDLGDEPLDVTRLDEAAVHAHQPVVLDSLSEPEQRGLGVGDVEPPDLAEENVQAEFCRKLLVELQACVHEGDALGCEVVGADDGRVATACSRAEVALVEDGDTLHAEFGKVIRGRETVYATADDYHVVVRREDWLPPKLLFLEYLEYHQDSPFRTDIASRPNGVIPWCWPASMTDSHMWSP